MKESYLEVRSKLQKHVGLVVNAELLLRPSELGVCCTNLTTGSSLS